MTKGTHLLAGSLISAYFHGPVFPALIGSVFPDIDLVKGFPKRRNLFNSHRGITHHPMVVVFLLAVAVLFKPYLGNFYKDFLSFIFGYLSHLILDALNPLGIPISFGYYPRFSVRMVRSGGLGEILVFYFILVAFVMLLTSGDVKLADILGEQNLSLIKSIKSFWR